MFDTERLSNVIWEEIFKEKNILPIKEFFDSIKGANEFDCNLLFKKYYPLSNISFIELKKIKNERLFANIEKNGVPIKPYLFELLDYLKKEHINILLATSSSKKIATYYLQNAKVINYFDFLTFGDEITHSKPNPDIFIKTMNKVNGKKEETLVLEDSKNGVLAAVNGKMNCIWIKDTVNFQTPSNVIKKDNLKEVIDYIEKRNKENVNN